MLTFLLGKKFVLYLRAIKRSPTSRGQEFIALLEGRTIKIFSGVLIYGAKFQNSYLGRLFNLLWSKFKVLKSLRSLRASEANPLSSKLLWDKMRTCNLFRDVRAKGFKWAIWLWAKLRTCKCTSVLNTFSSIVESLLWDKSRATSDLIPVKASMTSMLQKRINHEIDVNWLTSKNLFFLFSAKKTVKMTFALKKPFFFVKKDTYFTKYYLHSI